MFIKNVIAFVILLFSFYVWHIVSEPLKENVEIPLNHQICFNQCYNNLTYFYQCMEKCSTTWLFGKNYDCGHPVAVPEVRIACNPSVLKTNILERKTDFGEIVQYMYMSWTPCKNRIEDLTGYAIGFQEYHSTDISHLGCYNLSLYMQNASFRLLPANQSITMWFIAPLRLGYKQKLKLSLLALPSREASPVLRKSYTTKGCTELNGLRSCFCVSDDDILLSPNITVLGYSVLVLFFPSRKCSYHYNATLYYQSQRLNKTFRINQSFLYNQPENDSTIIRHRFDEVFVSEMDNLFLKIAATYKNQPIPIASRSYPIEMKAWLPPKPNITNFGSHEYEAWFQLPPSDFIVDSYMFRIGHYDRNGSILQLKSIYKEYEVKASQMKNGILSQRFSLVSGIYGVEIRESRPTNISQYLLQTKWGPMSTIIIKADYSNLYLILAVALTLAFVFFLFLIFASLIRAGKLKPPKKYIPMKLYDILVPQQVSSSKTVFLVWQVDFRSQSLNDSYKELVRSFGSFLALECGLEVIIDQCEEIDLSNSYAQWISNSVERADIVIFVCPHFDYSKLNGKSQSYIGNFTNAFSYMERSILSNQQKYVCVKFPFADLSLNSHTKFLYNLITSFEVMDQIEDLYFRIQGFSHNCLIVKKTVGNIEKSRYVNTEVGRDLHELLIAFNDELERFNSGEVNEDKLESSDEDQSLMFSNHQDPDPGGDFYPIPVNLASFLDSTCEQETPLMVQSLSNVTPLAVSDSPVLKPRSRLEPIVPFTKDPNQAIREMNEASGNSFLISGTNSMFSSTYPCSYLDYDEDQYSSCDDLSSYPSYSIDVVTASCFHTNELDSISTSSRHLDEMSPHKEYKINVTSPKSTYDIGEERDDLSVNPQKKVGDSGFNSGSIS